MVLTVAILTGVTLWMFSTRTQPHHVNAVFTDAFNVYPGLDVRANGLDIGKVSHTEYKDGEALVRLGINDSSYWPLHQGTQLEIRWGTTIGSGTRYVALTPGPKSNPAIVEDGIIPVQDTTPAVNVDQVVNLLNARERARMLHLTSSLAKGIGPNTTAMNQGLAATGPALSAASNMFSELSADTNSLKLLVSNGDRTTAVLANEAGNVSGLITVAARTFQVFASNTQAMQASMQDVAPTLSQTRTTLTRVDTSVGHLRTLMSALAPGAAALPALATTAKPALNDVYHAVPPLLSTVRSVTANAPAVSNTLNTGTSFISDTGTLTQRMTPIIACLRPYAPETGGALIGLDSWFDPYSLVQPNAPEEQAQGGPNPTFPERQINGLAEFHGARAEPNVSAESFHSYPPPFNSAAFVSLFGKSYAFPRAPGQNVGQPHWMPECGITPDSLDPAKDPEAGMP
jgi:ABC-type transporter Mla subunit MlaD